MNNSEKVGFLAVDACLEVGTRRPFNFVGQLTETEMESIRSFVNEARNTDVNYLFWFGHYPTSTIQYPESEKVKTSKIWKFLFRYPHNCSIGAFPKREKNNRPKILVNR